MKLKEMIIATIGIIFSTIPQSLRADVTGQTVYSIIIDNGTPAYSFFRVSPLCSYSANAGTQYCGTNFVFDPSTSQGKSILSTLLTAKSTGNKIAIECNKCPTSSSTTPPSSGQDFGTWAFTINKIILE